jgi:phosphatidylglycerophosphate synthase
VSEPALASWDSYTSQWSKLHGGYDPRHASPFVRGWLRLAYGLSRILAPLPVSPNAVTAFGLGLSACVPLLAWWGGGWPVAGALLLVGTALADTVDGALAVTTDRTSRLGQLYDSVADRLAEACWLAALWLLGAPPLLVVLCGGLAWLHEYVRARATPAGMADIGTVTVAERPTRILIAAFGLLLCGFGGLISPELAIGTATAATAIWAILGSVALGQLIGAVHRALR